MRSLPFTKSLSPAGRSRLDAIEAKLEISPDEADEIGRHVGVLMDQRSRTDPGHTSAVEWSAAERKAIEAAEAAHKIEADKLDDLRQAVWRADTSLRATHTEAAMSAYGGSRPSPVVVEQAQRVVAAADTAFNRQLSVERAAWVLVGRARGDARKAAIARERRYLSSPAFTPAQIREKAERRGAA